MSNLIFPIDCGRTSWNTSKKQSWDVEEYVSASGERKTLVQQTYPSWSFSVDFPMLCKADTDKLMAFYAQCKGSWKPFFFKLYDDCFVPDKTLVEVTENVYQAVIPIDGYEEPAELIDNVVVFVDGKKTDNFTVEGGLITVNEPGEIITFDYEYYWRVAFDSKITIKQKFNDFYTVSFTVQVAR